MQAQRNALVTGGSRGLGRALARGLVDAGWRVLIDGRDTSALEETTRDRAIVVLAGDVNDPGHRVALAQRAAAWGGLDLLVNNAGTLGPVPRPALAAMPLDGFATLFRDNVIAPLGIVQGLLAHMRPGAMVVNITSDASREAYAGWGGYGASKAALDQVSAVLGAEHPELAVYAFDPGDLRTDMHQAAFPGEDISDRRDPRDVVPVFLRLLETRPPSGRYTITSVSEEVPA